MESIRNFITKKNKNNNEEASKLKRTQTKYNGYFNGYKEYDKEGAVKEKIYLINISNKFIKK